MPHADLIPATYEDGVLKPTTPLDLDEQTPVLVRVLPQSATERKQIRAAFRAAGLSSPLAAPEAVEGKKLSPERRAELAQRAAAGPPLSDIVIENRKDRV